jgi:rSAM/selenodomain-associated transferase 1
LVPPLTAVEAADLNTAFLQDIFGNLLRAGREAAIAPYVAFSPAGAESFFRDRLPASIPLIECSEPNFGDCLHRAVTELLQRGHAAACVVNADSPTLPTRLLVRAAQALEQPGGGIVIGPSTDGGYYLLGMKQAHRRLFDDIDWSTSRVLEQTRERAAELGLNVTVLEPWYDVDDEAGLHRLQTDLRQDRTTAANDGLYEASHTRAALARLNPIGSASLTPSRAVAVADADAQDDP